MTVPDWRPTTPPDRGLADRHDTLSVVLGIGAALVPPLPIIALAFAEVGNLISVWLVYFIVLPVVAIILFRRASQQQRGWGVGLLIGWGIVLIIGVGLWIALLLRP